MSRKVHLNIAIPVSMKEEIRELCVKYKDTENDVRTLTDISIICLELGMEQLKQVMHFKKLKMSKKHEPKNPN
jgi:hypothetical protein